MAYDPNTPAPRRSAGPSWLVWLAVAIVAVVVAAGIWWAVADEDEDEDAGLVQDGADEDEEGALEEEDEDAFRFRTGRPMAFTIDGVTITVAA